MKKFVCIASLVAVFFIAISTSTYAQMKTVTSPTKYQTVQYPARLKAQLPKTPAELKARMPKLQPIAYPALRKPLPPRPGQKVLVVLQENSGNLIFLPDSTPANLEAMIEAVVDTLAETFEDLKSQLQGFGKYDKVVLLTDNNCKRSKLLDNLVYYTKQGMTIDLLILGHGEKDKLSLNNEYLYGAPTYNSNIRTLLNDARRRGCQKINLRLVYMCNCWGGTTNDDWQAIGARISIGPLQNNWMPEPQITFFLHNWLGGQKSGAAAYNSYNESIPFYSLIFPPTATIRFKKVRKRYPCGTYWDPNCYVFGVKTGCFRIKFCTAELEVPDGVDLQPHPKVWTSQPIISGSKASRLNWTFHTVY